jgi:hypothetical protein
MRENKFNTLEGFKAEIKRAADLIPVEEIKLAVMNFTTRVRNVEDAREPTQINNYFK